LCYNDCARVGMVNCGIGACAMNAANCASSIVNMVMDTVLAIG